MPRIYLLVMMLAVAIGPAPSARAFADSAPPEPSGGAQLAPQPNQPANSTPQKSTAGKSTQTKSSSHAGKSSTAIALSQTVEVPAKLPQMVIVVTPTRMATPIGELGVAA